MKHTKTRLLVHNFKACFNFYSQQLGLKVIWGSTDDVYAAFECQNLSSLAIYDANLMVEAVKDIKVDRRTHVDRFVVTIGVEDVDTIYQKLQKEGVVFLNEPHDEPGWGDRVVHLRDPEGNLVELSQMMALKDWNAELLKAKEKYDYEL